MQQWREHGGNIFEDVAAATGANVTVGATRGNAAQTVQAARVSANFILSWFAAGARPKLHDRLKTNQVARTFQSSAMIFGDSISADATMY